MGEKSLVTKRTLLVCLTLVVGFSAVVSLDYTDLETMGAACTGRDSCQNMEKPDDFFQRNCECDGLCRTFGDCCIDAPPSPEQNEGDGGLEACMPYGKTPNLGAYVISSCPHQVGSSTSECTRNNLLDPFLSAPVSIPDGATYRNAFCAECNGADLANLVMWAPLVNCATLAPYNLSADFVWGGIVPAADGDGEWGVWFWKQFHRCDVLFDKPDSVKNLRMCRADVVSKCPSKYRRKGVVRRCESYTAVVYTNKATYRNPHCAVCNNVLVDTLVCSYDELLRRNNNRFTFAHLFDVDRSNGDCVGLVHCCSEEQIYDPFSKRCRKLVCGRPGDKIVNKICVKA